MTTVVGSYIARLRESIKLITIEQARCLLLSKEHFGILPEYGLPVVRRGGVNSGPAYLMPKSAAVGINDRPTRADLPRHRAIVELGGHARAGPAAVPSLTPMVGIGVQH